jgi:hypothetical protein
MRCSSKIWFVQGQGGSFLPYGLDGCRRFPTQLDEGLRDDEAGVVVASVAADRDGVRAASCGYSWGDLPPGPAGSGCGPRGGAGRRPAGGARSSAQPP